MGNWTDIETGVVQALLGLTWGESPLLATVTGRTVLDRKQTAAAILRERLPAAYVIAGGRGATERNTGRAGRPAITVLLATRSYRSSEGARTGEVESPGIFYLAESVQAALHNLGIGSDGRLALTREEMLPGEGGAALWEQTYEFRRQAQSVGPTFGGVALAGGGSRVRVELGELRAVVSSFAFPGIDGVFERRLGLRERPIWWRGELRAATDADLNAIESAIEDELRGGQAKLMVDAWERQHEGCVLKAFRREGPRRRDEPTGEVVQDCEIEFTQLGG